MPVKQRSSHPASPPPPYSLAPSPFATNLYTVPPPQQTTVHFYPAPAPYPPPNLPYQPYSPYAYNQQISVPPPPPTGNPAKQSCWSLSGSISQTLYDAGDLAYGLHDQITGSGKVTDVLDAVSLRFNDVITSMDDGSFSGKESDLGMKIDLSGDR
jgi:hypothetical protein